MAGAYHGVEEADCEIHVGISGPGVVKRALEKVKGEPMDIVADTIKKAAFQITRMGQLVGNIASQKLGVPFGIVDLALAPTPAVGDSVGEILEEFGLGVVGTHGTVAALAVLNDAVKKGGVMACSHVGGLSGSFIPVSEDHRSGCCQPNLVGYVVGDDGYLFGWVGYDRNPWQYAGDNDRGDDRG